MTAYPMVFDGVPTSVDSDYAPGDRVTVLGQIATLVEPVGRCAEHGNAMWLVVPDERPDVEIVSCEDHIRRRLSS